MTEAFTFPTYELPALKGASSRRERSTESMHFVGFNYQQETSIRHVLANLGLPLDNIDQVQTARVGQHGSSPNTIAMYGDQSTTDYNGKFVSGHGTLYIFPIFFSCSRKEARSTLVHEVSHSLSPFKPRASRNYMRERDIQLLGEYVTRVLDQCLRSGLPLNIPSQHAYGMQIEIYHQVIIEQYQSGSYPYDRLLEETWAILVQFRFDNPDALRELEREQAAALKGGEYVPLTSSGSEAEGVDIPLLYLTQSKDLKALNTLIAEVSRL